jgi:hypothetical protein
LDEPLTLEHEVAMASHSSAPDLLTPCLRAHVWAQSSLRGCAFVLSWSWLHDEKASHRSDEKASHWSDERASHRSHEKASHWSDERASHRSHEKASHTSDERASRRSDEKASHWSDERASHRRCDEKPSHRSGVLVQGGDGTNPHQAMHLRGRLDRVPRRHSRPLRSL